MEFSDSEILLQDDYGDELNITDISLRYLYAEELSQVTYQKFTILLCQRIANGLPTIANDCQRIANDGQSLAICWQSVGNPLAIVGNRWHSIGSH